MKKTILFVAMFFFLASVDAQDSLSGKFNDTLLLQVIEVTSVRASEKAPFSKTTLSKSEIAQRNLGNDLPFIFNQMPSVVASSDAGNGVGYTNMRIRGSDATRINVTLNGIPFNDAESQGTFFVNMPDIASSVESVQIQRGVGTSSNGAGAFGASINLNTNEVIKEKYFRTDNTFGSFNTWKNSVMAGSGLIKNHFTIDGRFSNITSDGYIDRASSNLKSYYGSAAYLDRNTTLRFNIISGNEKTYQAWNGLAESMLQTDRTYNSAGTEKPGTPYKNETDNYIQTHYQLFLNQRVNDAITLNVTGFLVRGKGYYENYKASQKFSKYGLPDYHIGGETLQRTDLILQRWLDNYFYGTIFSGQYAKGKTHLTFGGGYSRYDGDHFNRIIWAEVGIPKDYSSYLLPAHKQDLNFYGKWMQSLGSGFNSFIDIQQRVVNYEIFGFKDNPDLFIKEHYSFLNPKLGVSYFSGSFQAFASFSIATKEPNRKDFEANVDDIPKPEKLLDWEAGVSLKKQDFSAGINLYYMDYKDQLVNTGKINDVGALTRVNTPESYRAGIEIEAQYQPVKWFAVGGNVAVSKNKIKNFDEYIYDESENVVVNHFSNTDISYSPNTVAGGFLTFIPMKNGEITFTSKFVGDQYLDNTSDKSRMLKRYFNEDMRLAYTLAGKPFKETKLIFQINNLFNRLYEPNGHTYNYITGGELQVENFYFPMAGINFMAGVNITL